MNKVVVICFSVVILLSTQLEAACGCWWQRCWCRGRCFSDITTANYDGICYGYIDNINYPDTYRHPLNYCFRNRPLCPRSFNNYQYFLKCAYYTNSQK